VKGVLFDLDGTLVDSEPLHQLSVVLVLRKYGHKVEPELMHDYTGWSERNFWQELRKRFGLQETPERLVQARTAAYRGLVHVNSVELMDGAKELLTTLKQANIPCAIASSSAKAQILATLAAAEISDYFQVVLSGHEDVANGKPAPDIYLLAAEKLKLPIETCLAVEDSSTGTTAAVASGAWTIRIPTPGITLQKSDEQLRAESLHEVVEIITRN